MRRIIYFLSAFLMGLVGCKQKAVEYSSYEEYPYYEGSLWPEFSKERSSFKIWSPTASEVKLNVYENGTEGESLERISLKKNKEGVWQAVIDGDYLGKYYTYSVKINEEWLAETPGIYALSTGVNGKRACIIDLNETNPEGWYNDQKPEMENANEAIIYELHVRDLTLAPSSGSNYEGKFLGIVEEGTTNEDGEKTGLDHMKELGITHLHLLPVFDYRSVDESKLDQPQFNWGYDPENYNVPEGSYSTDPYQGEVRVKEFKEMVMKLHQNGIRVIMDVVYNHTGKTDDSNFNLEVPGYYYRHNEEGSWSDASGCGNETASELPMMRKFMVESVKYWAEEYHVDGFRFDLMGIHDIETMNQISSELAQIDPSIIVYGEGWTAGGSPLEESKRALKANTPMLNTVAAFSDDIRDGLKGSVFDEMSTGFVSGAEEMEETIKFGVVASTNHPQLDYEKVNYSKAFWANEPSQCITYVSCHDNHTLFDKLHISREDASAQELRRMHKLSLGIVLTSQGIPFLHAGTEMMRTKHGEHNSYNKPDSLNQLDWDAKTATKDVFNFVKGLIAMRKAHPAFRMTSSQELRSNLNFAESRNGLVAYEINGEAVGDDWNKMFIVYNRNVNAEKVTLPDGEWQVAVKGDKVTLEGGKSASSRVTVPAISMAVLYQN